MVAFTNCICSLTNGENDLEAIWHARARQNTKYDIRAVTVCISYDE